MLLREIVGCTPPVFFTAAACPLPVLSYSQLLLLPSPVVGVGWGFTPRQSFHCLITHISPQSPPSLPPKQGIEKGVSCFGSGWLEFGSKVVLVLTVVYSRSFVFM